MEFERSYLKQRWRGLAGAAVGCGILLVSFWLYDLPLGAVLYPAALCALYLRPIRLRPTCITAL